jgi:putative chitinase
VATPALAAQPKTAAIIAGTFWKARGCNPHADAGDIAAVTRLINGGQTDLAQRELQTHRASMIWR